VRNLGIVLVNLWRLSLNTSDALFTLFLMDHLSEWNTVDSAHPERYPPLAFWDVKSSSTKLGLAHALSMFSYVIFGSVHCLAWNFSSLSDVAKWVWRGASIAVAAIPLQPLLINGINMIPETSFACMGVFIWFILFIIVTAASASSLILFIPARMALLVLPFLELGHLSSSALQTISWDVLFPHID
jgi:hypothetical protein